MPHVRYPRFQFQDVEAQGLGNRAPVLQYRAIQIPPPERCVVARNTELAGKRGHRSRVVAG